MNAQYYMTRPEEIEKHARLVAAKGGTPDDKGMMGIIIHLACGDLQLFDAMWSFINFAHAFDDALDESNWTGDIKEAAVTSLHNAVVEALTTTDAELQADFASLFVRITNKWDQPRQRLARMAFDDFFKSLRFNPFITSHYLDIRAMLVQALTRWLDGDEMEAKGNVLAPAVRCADVDVVFHMVYLARGWVALRECSKFREYDLPEQLTKEAA